MKEEIPDQAGVAHDFFREVPSSIPNQITVYKG